MARIVYRAASMADFDAVLAISKELYEESWHSETPWDADVAGAFVKRYLTRSDKGIIVAEREGELIGFIYGELNPLSFSRELSVLEVLWYVSPAYRGSMAGVRLLKFLERWGRENGAKYYFCGHSTLIDADRTDRLFRRLGFLDTGVVFRRALK